MIKQCAIVHVKTRNDAISIGALCIKKELELHGWKVDICNYQYAHKYRLVLVSMTSTWDIYDIYKQMKNANWNNRQFIAIVGGFGCQNPFALYNFVDYAFFGRAENIINEVCTNAILNKNLDYSFITPLNKVRKTIARPVQQLYDFSVKYGKNNSTWTELFTGCPHKCKFCHYSYNRKNLRKGNLNEYINDGISTGSKEIMLVDIPKYTEKLGRVTAALDGYSERLRYLFGKHISWEQVEQSLDHLASFKGNVYLKLYNIVNFPTETLADEQEFDYFFNQYAEYTEKKDGLLKVEVFNTAFRPSLNTPMERMAVNLFPEARKDILTIAQGKGIIIKYTSLIQGAFMHLADLIAIRYTSNDLPLIDQIATDKQFNKLSNEKKLETIAKNYDINKFLREYSWEEPFITDLVSVENAAQIKKRALKLI